MTFSVQGGFLPTRRVKTAAENTDDLNLHRDGIPFFCLIYVGSDGTCGPARSIMISPTRLLVLCSLAAGALADYTHAPYMAQQSLGESHLVAGSDQFSTSSQNATKWSSPSKGLSALDSDEFTTLRHPAFPEHSVRIKRVDGWCEPTAKSALWSHDVM